MEMIQSLSFFLMVLATVFMARTIRQYADGIKRAGALQLKLPRRRWNFDVFGTILFLVMGLNDLLFGDRLFGVIIMVLGAWWLARAIRPYQFHEHGAILEMEYVDWQEVKSWSWKEDGSPEVVLHLAGKPTRPIRSTEGQEALEAFLKAHAGAAAVKTPDETE